MNISISIIFLICLNSFQLNFAAAGKQSAAGASKQAAGKTLEQNTKVVHVKAPPTHSIKEQLPNGATLKRVLANRLKPTQDFSHFFNVMEIDTAFGGKHMTRDEIVRTVSIKVEAYINHTHMLGLSVTTWKTTHKTKIIELIFNELPKKLPAAPVITANAPTQKAAALPVRNAQPPAAPVSPSSSEVDLDFGGDPFAYDIERLC